MGIVIPPEKKQSRKNLYMYQNHYSMFQLLARRLPRYPMSLVDLGRNGIRLSRVAITEKVSEYPW